MYVDIYGVCLFNPLTTSCKPQNTPLFFFCSCSALALLQCFRAFNADSAQEFSSLAEDANIYKLVGPVLLKQDTAEAKSTVDGRLEFIDKEM